MKKIPYWHQTSEASCGPACLLMTFNYYNPSYGLTREREWEIWREASLLTLRGTHPYGLAAVALRKGFKVTLIREKKTVWKDSSFPESNESLRYSIKEQEKKAKSLGLVEKLKRKIDLPFLKDLLEKNVYPIVLMRFVKRNRTLGFPHYVVVINLEKNYIVINDPYAYGNRKIPIKLFMKGWNGIRMEKWGMNKEILIIEK